MNLVLSICLAATPDACRDELVLISVAPIAAMVCMVAAPATIAEWSEANAAWTVRRWRCALLDQGARR